MNSFPWLTTLLVLPLVGALVVALLPKGSNLVRPIALGVSLVSLAIGIGALTQYEIGSGEQFQLTEVHSWIPQFGVSYALGVDGIALTMILLSLVLVPICIIAAWDDVPVDGSNRRHQLYFALMLSLSSVMVGVFAAMDVFLFYVFFEVMLIPVYFLIGMFGGSRRIRAATTFLLYSLAGGLIMLVAVIGVYLAGPRGPQGFLMTELTGNLDLSVEAGRWLFLGFFIAFAIKAPMWPVHTWLPLAAEQARPATSVLLVGVLDKVGTYGMIRFCLSLFPEASQWATPVILVLAVISIVVGALLAIGSNDILRLISYTSISHFGFIVMGIFAFTAVSQTGATLYMVNHGFTTAALFLVAGMLIVRRGSRDMRDFGGWQRVTPLIAGSLLVAGLSGLALPGLNSFVSEFMVIIGTFQRHPWVAFLSMSGVILAAVYIMVMYQKVATGPKPEEATVGHVTDMSGREKWVVAPLIAAFLVLGFYPKPVIDILEPAVQFTQQVVGISDPAPAVDSASAEGSGR